MAQSNVTGVGSSAAASACANLRGLVTDATPGLVSSTLLTLHMPGLRFWLKLTNGAAGATALPQFAANVDNGGNDDWQPLSAPVALLLGVPTILVFSLPVAKIRFVAAGNGAFTIDYLLGALAGG